MIIIINFTQEYENWNRKYIEGSFVICRTTKALKNIGLKGWDIVIDKTKLIKIQNDHPAMNHDVIKSIPNILEKPTLILKSQSQNKKAKSRIVIFGEINDVVGNPVLVALELNPRENEIYIYKIYKVVSAYGKENIKAIQAWINNKDNILYIDEQKNRTINWLYGLGLQLPVPNNTNSSINIIAFSKENVNMFYHFMLKYQK